ncbi:hypothetical protein AYX13_07042 [Cryptococcus neoformans]|nr:hypothetical protein AYX13_07042 [Cryptococcus neoformans var. grubii]
MGQRLTSYTHLAPELSVPPILLERRISANGPPFSALFDTGVTVTLVDPSLVTTHHLPSYPSEQRRLSSKTCTGCNTCGLSIEELQQTMTKIL